MQRSPFLALTVPTSLVVVAFSACGGGDEPSAEEALEAADEAAIQATNDASFTPEPTASSAKIFVTGASRTPTAASAPTTTPLFQPAGEDIFSARVEDSAWSQVGSLDRLRVTHLVRNLGENPLMGDPFILRAVGDEGLASFPATNLLPNIGAGGS